MLHAQEPSTLSVAALSPWLTNGVTVDQTGALFLSHPRFKGHEESPSLTRVGRDGRPTPFPGRGWNSWRPGDDGAKAFVFVNAVHIFADGTLWVVDQGAPEGGKPGPGAQKLVQLDPVTGEIRRILPFDSAILPAGAQMNDLRVHGDRLYVTDSGLGGLILHDLASGQSRRRLSEHPLLRKAEAAVQKGTNGRALRDAKGKRPSVNSDVIELSAVGDWLYWAPPTGPIRRIPTAVLWDDALDDAALAKRIEYVADTPSIGGTAIDTLANLYLSDAEHRRITVLTPDGARATLIADERLVSPDALFIDVRRRLLIPAPQLERMAGQNGGREKTRPPYAVYALQLPETLAGHRLGDAVTGRLTIAVP